MQALWGFFGIAALIAGPVFAQDEEIVLPPIESITSPWGSEGPPAMGTITGVGDGDTINWTTFDFSVGAFDASAWVTRNNDGHGPETVSIVGYTAWDSEIGRIFIKADIAGYHTGTYQAEVILFDQDRDAPRQKGLLTIDVSVIRQDAERDAYGDFKASLSGTICSVQTPTDCFVADFTVDTRLQYGF